MYNFYRCFIVIIFLMVFQLSYAAPNYKKNHNYGSSESKNYFIEERSFFDNLETDNIPDRFQLDEVVIGDKNAPVTIIVYSSFTCHYCKKFYENELPKFKKLIDNKKVKFYLRGYIDNQETLAAYYLTRCLGGKSIEKIKLFYSKIFENQESWLKSKNEQEAIKSLEKEFLNQNISLREIEACKSNINILNGLRREQKRTMYTLKISLIPAFIIENSNDTKIHQGILNYEELLKMSNIK